MNGFLKRGIWRVLRPIRQWFVRQTRSPRVGHVGFGDLRRLKPISDVWGADRGHPVDRFYIERFLDRHAADVCGHVLEIGTADYTRRFGADRVSKSDVLHIAENKPDVTIIGDLSKGDNIPSVTFDCVILTQTLHIIYDFRAAVQTIYRILKPGGVLLATFPGITRISRYDMDRWGHYWSYTTRSAHRIFENDFAPDDIEIETHGNVLTAIAFLHGISAHELTADELAYSDPDYELLITVRARRIADF